VTSLDPIGNGPYSTISGTHTEKTKANAARESASRAAGASGTLAASTLKITGDKLDSGKLRETLTGILGQFHKGEALTSAVDSAMRAVKGLEEKVKGGKAVEFRIVGLDASHGTDGGFGAAASVRGFGVEVGIVRDDKVAAADVEVLDIDGRAAGLSKGAKAAGIQAGRYTLSVDLPTPRQDGSVAGAEVALARLAMVRSAMDMFSPLFRPKQSWWS